jgi:hypothetical protein
VSLHEILQGNKNIPSPCSLPVPLTHSFGGLRNSVHEKQFLIGTHTIVSQARLLLELKLWASTSLLFPKSAPGKPLVKSQATWMENFSYAAKRAGGGFLSVLVPGQESKLGRS